MATIDCWHAQTDTLPRLCRRPDPESNKIDLVLTAGISVVGDAQNAPQPPNITITINGQDATEITRLDLEARFAEADRRQLDPDRNKDVRPYADMYRQMQSTANRYFELRITGTYGDTLRYSIQYNVDGVSGYANNLPSGTFYEVVLVDPELTAEHIRFVHNLQPSADPYPDPDSWILLAASENGYDCLQLDMLDSISSTPGQYFALPGVRFDFPDGEHVPIDVGAGPNTDYPLPIIDRNTDTIRVCIKRRDGNPLRNVTVTTTSNNVSTAQAVTLDGTRHWPTRLLLFNYCIQGLNDLFSPPLPSYDPPRTYIEVTLRDEKAQYSSRPDRPDSGVPDGYWFTLEAHRCFGVKSQWVFNAGVLALIAHDTPEVLESIRDDIKNHLIAPSNAGFGAHRLAYYEAETNWRELVAGREVLRRYLDYDGPALDVYYPDQRLFKNGGNERDPLTQAGVQYIVLDRSTVCHGPENDPVQYFPYPDGSANFVWTLADTNKSLGLLLIEDLFRTNIDSWNDDLTLRGKADLALRRLFMRLVKPADQKNTDPNSPNRPLVVYGDDADKASGNGWFDGIDYDGHRYHLNDMYIAFLRWVSTHPWVEAITSDELKLEEDARDDLDVSSATCPSVDPGGASSVDEYGQLLHFDMWYSAWKEFPADWLGESLWRLSDALETDLINWPDAHHNQLYELAWLYFLMFTHESFWNKEPADPNAVNTQRGVLEPEDFVIAESLQQRHAWVFLYASRWADWGAKSPDGSTHVDEGRSFASQAEIDDAGGLHWDHDLLPNVIMYNNQVLVVMDLNGGCVTNIFIIVDGEAVCVSGHFKSFQYLDTAHKGVGINPGIMSNGVVFQNTVFTPNHAYVAADVRQSAPILGTYAYPRAVGSLVQDWNYPNNFNAYGCERVDNTCVRFRYGPATSRRPETLDRDSFSDFCLEDRVRRLAGSTGLVWHDAPAFEKEFSLDGRILTVRYRDVPKGHVVSNELCVDLYNAVLSRQFQEKTVAPDNRSIVVRSPARGSVTVRLGDGCEFSPAALWTVPPTRSDDLSEYLTLHRVLTDNLQIECAAGGAFDYSVIFG